MLLAMHNTKQVGKIDNMLGRAMRQDVPDSYIWWHGTYYSPGADVAKSPFGVKYGAPGCLLV
jgi:hypothetical protein